MSLDVYLEGEEETVECLCPYCDHKHTRTERPEYYWENITHNLGKMAAEAGIYKHLWHPEDIGITKAHQLIEPLEKGLALMRSDPARFKLFNAPNGWGMYDNFLPFVQDYLDACREYPDANVRVSR